MSARRTVYYVLQCTPLHRESNTVSSLSHPPASPIKRRISKFAFSSISENLLIFTSSSYPITSLLKADLALKFLPVLGNRLIHGFFLW